MIEITDLSLIIEIYNKNLKEKYILEQDIETEIDLIVSDTRDREEYEYDGDEGEYEDDPDDDTYKCGCCTCCGCSCGDDINYKDVYIIEKPKKEDYPDIKEDDYDYDLFDYYGDYYSPFLFINYILSLSGHTIKENVYRSLIGTRENEGELKVYGFSRDQFFDLCGIVMYIPRDFFIENAPREVIEMFRPELLPELDKKKD